MARPFVVIFTARSGSTALFGNLKEHPQILMRAEVFGNAMLPGDLPQTDDNRVAFLRRFWGGFKAGRQPADGLSRGFKFQVTRTGEQFTAPMRFAKVASEYDPAVIVLRRRNRLKQAVSAINARRLKKFSAELTNSRGSAHVTEEHKDLLTAFRNETFTVDLEDLEQLLKGIERSYEYLDRVAEKFPERLEIQYEDYAIDRDRVVGQVLGHIGVDVEAWEPGDRYVKITSDDLSRSVTNFDELRAFAERHGMADMVGPPGAG